MKKILGIVTVTALMLMGCDAKQAQAQNEASGMVGTPDSENMVIIEQGYEVMAPANPSNNPNNNMEALPGDPGVEVAPAPDNAQPAPNKNADGSTNSSNPEYQGSITVDETVTEEVSD